MAIKRRDFQKLSSTVQEFLLKLPDEEESARLRDNLLHALHFLQLYYRVLQARDKNSSDPVQWSIDHSLSPLTPFKEAPDKFEWEWLNADSGKLRQSLPAGIVSSKSLILPQVLTAIRDGDLTSLKQIIKSEPASIHATDALLRDPLTYAIHYDHYDILQHLIRNGASPSHPASDGSTPLHRAVYANRPTMVQLLLNSQANPDAQDCFGRAPLHWATVSADTDCLEVLLAFHANVAVKDKDGLSPMMWACHLDSLEHFKLLKKVYEKMFVDEPDTDADGRTWVHWAVRKAEPFKCLNYLIQSESAILIRDRDGRTCLHIAAEQGALQAAKIIIDTAGFKVINERDSKKQTPLHLATLHGQARAIKVLMDSGADPNLKDTTGASPIDYVTKRNLFFCNSIIEICLRNIERKGRLSNTNSVASSFNGSETNITPAPPTTPKSTFTRSFQQLSVSKDMSGRPPRPVTNSSSLNATDSIVVGTKDELLRTAPASLPFQAPSPPTVAKNRPFNRGGWNSAERLTSASLRLSRASTRTSLASDDLDRYMNTTEQQPQQFGGSLGNIDQPNNNGFLQHNSGSLNNGLDKPFVQPRVVSSKPVRLLSGGRSHDNVMQSAASYDGATGHMPPPVKPRKASSIASLNNSINESNRPLNTYHSNENNFNPKSIRSDTINYGSGHQKQQSIKPPANKIDVVDISEDETSITSVKGEGFASDLSESEAHHPANYKASLLQQQLQQPHHLKLSQRVKSKSKDSSLRRPTTPMEIHQNSKTTNPLRGPGSRYKKQMSRDSTITTNNNNNNDLNNSFGSGNVQQPTGRFNEWDPYNKPESRKKSPNVRAAILSQQQQNPQIQQSQQQPSTNTSTFAHTFLGTDSSPRQTSGRSQLGSATKTHQQQLQQQQQQQGSNNQTNSEVNCASNLDLMVSGQRLGGGRKELSPTGTPRDMGVIGIVAGSKGDLHRPFMRRLQPLEKGGADVFIPVQMTPGRDPSADGQNQVFMRTKKTPIDRKKLEPIRISALNNLNMTNINTDGFFSPGQSIAEDRDNPGLSESGSNTLTTNNQHVTNNDEELSISENTISSDKPVNLISRNARKKKSRFNQNQNQNQNRKKLIEDH